MSGQILAIELTAISQEARRKHGDIRTAAEKSLQELKSLPSTSEQQLAADLIRRGSFVDPFVQAAVSRNARLANSAIVSLQRLIVIKGLPSSRLVDVLEGFQASSTLSLDVQLKILQALPALAQNYSHELTGDLLAATIRVCAALQNAKVTTVSAVAAATLQQLIVLVFDKLAAEDAAKDTKSSLVLVDLELDGSVKRITQAAHDAYQVLRDIAQASQGERATYLDLKGIPASVGLELIYAILSSHPDMIALHGELVKVLKDNVVQFLINLLSERQSFPVTVRAIRIVPLIIQRYTGQMSEEAEILLGLLTHLLDPDSSPPWKRIMVMEVFKIIYSTPGLVIYLYTQFDQQERSKAIMRDNISSFVRISTEKPGLIGLGRQSTAPALLDPEEGESIDTASIEAAGGVAGVISSTVTESTAPGVSSQWSTPKGQILDLLDKSDPPAFPETYIYSLTLECLNSLSDNLAKVILPLTMSQDAPSKRKSRNKGGSEGDDKPVSDSSLQNNAGLQRSRSYRSSTIPINPLTLGDIPAAPKVKAIADLLDDCWPALLATCSTYLYSALDNNYYRGLIRSFQRFTQVSGLLDLNIARDAFLTTLGKAAVPPNLLNSLSSSVAPSTAVRKASAIFTTTLNAQPQLSNAAARRPSLDPTGIVLSTRNLLCLRALLNLAIALGPTLKDSFAIVLGTLQHADVYFEVIGRTSAGASMASLGSEIEAVRHASRRLLESTADYPNEAFAHILEVICKSIDDGFDPHSVVQSPTESRRPSGSDFGRRPATISVSSADSTVQGADLHILMSKLGRLVDVNASRFTAYVPSQSGWQRLAECLIPAATQSCMRKESRTLASDIFCRACTSLVKLSIQEPIEDREKAQKLAVTSLQQLVADIFAYEQSNSTGIFVYCRALEAIKSIIDTSGDNLVVGWNIILEVLQALFNGSSPAESNESQYKDRSQSSLKPSSLDEDEPEDLEKLVATNAGRLAFSILQIICSDFLGALESSLIITISDLLRRFALQREDVNMSLTAITLFSDVSSFLLQDNARQALEDIASPQTNISPDQIFEDLKTNKSNSRAAQWVILLKQLSEVAADDRVDIRNGAFQTLLRVLSDQSLEPHAFQFAFTGVLLKVLDDSAKALALVRNSTQDHSPTPIQIDVEAPRSLLDGVARYLSQNIETFEQTSQFRQTWSRWISIMGTFLSARSHAINQSVYAGLTAILVGVKDLHSGWSFALEQVMSAWSAGIPQASETDAAMQQEAFLAYVACARELTRLSSDEFGLRGTKAIARNGVNCIRLSVAGRFDDDSISMTKLQSSVVALLRSLMSNVSGVPEVLVKTAAGLSRLPFDDQNRGQVSDTQTPTFVALCKIAMQWMVELFKEHERDAGLFTSGAVHDALRSLSIPIGIKYHWSKNGKSPAPWTQATTSALVLLPIVLNQLQHQNLPEGTLNSIWQVIVEITSAVVHGDYAPLSIPSRMEDVRRVEEDEQFDAASLLTLRAIVIPHLGSPRVHDSVRTAYCSALFTASIVHQRTDQISSSKTTVPLATMLKPLTPTVSALEPSRREDLGYLCLAELISLVSREPKSFNWHRYTTFASSYTPPDLSILTLEERCGLAAAAIPWLLARIATTVKGYVADQPLRAGGTAPTGVTDELVWILDRLGELRLVDAQIVGGEAVGWRREGGELQHLRVLHPILVDLIGVAGHKSWGNEEVLAAVGRVLDVYGRG